MRALSLRRSPALIMGLSLAGLTAAAWGVTASYAHTADDAKDTALSCEVALETVRGGTLLTGRVTSDSDVAGTYTMAITSRSNGGTTSIRQSGTFEAGANQPATLGETRLMGRPASQTVDLEITVNGQRVTCDQAEL